MLISYVSMLNRGEKLIKDIKNDTSTTKDFFLFIKHKVIKYEDQRLTENYILTHNKTSANLWK